MRVLLPIAIVTTLFASLVAPWLRLAVGHAWLFPSIYVAGIDRKARTDSLLYELEPAAEIRWHETNAALTRFASA